ncbi:MAG TPA: acyl carrier protein [bacterium]|nr:acyl carrier protein [bacterium]
MMDKKELKQKVKEVIAHVLEIEIEEISDDANFIFDLGADSAQSLELVAGFEEEFDIEMDEDRALEVQNVSDAVDFISEYTK